jgi:hypothetical protein
MKGLRPLALLFCTAVAVVLLSCNGAEGQGSGSGDAISGPPQMDALFHTRKPRKCAKVTKPPNVSQATALAQCDAEGETQTEIDLVTNVQLEMGAPRSFNPRLDSGWNDIDPSANVYPTRGHLVRYNCSSDPQFACSVFTADDEGSGACWKTSFGDWRCRLPLAPNFTAKHRQPGPTTY